MVKKYFLFILATLILSTFSSCGFIKMDFSVAAEQFTDFSPKETPEEDTDSGYINKPIGWGPCPATPPADPICGHVYAPVCGFNGITYKNACEARRAGVYNFFNGKCWKSDSRKNCR